MLAGGDSGNDQIAFGGVHAHRACKPPTAADLPLGPPLFIGAVRQPGADVRPPYDQRPMAASAQYSVTVRVELDARQEPLGKLTAQIAESGGSLVSVDLIPGAGPEGKRVREFTIDA